MTNQDMNVNAAQITPGVNSAQYGAALFAFIPAVFCLSQSVVIPALNELSHPVNINASLNPDRLLHNADTSCRYQSQGLNRIIIGPKAAENRGFLLHHRLAVTEPSYALSTVAPPAAHQDLSTGPGADIKTIDKERHGDEHEFLH